MNILDVKGDDFYPIHDSYSQLCQIEWDAVEWLSSTIGQEAVGAMVPSLGSDGQHAAITKFIQNELDTEREMVTLLCQQNS